MNASTPNTIAMATSKHAKVDDFHQAAEDITAKMINDPSHVTMEDAAYLESRESRALGGVRPPKESIAAEAKRIASTNVKAAAGNTKSNSDGTAPAAGSAPMENPNTGADAHGKADSPLEAEFHDAQQVLDHKCMCIDGHHDE